MAYIPNDYREPVVLGWSNEIGWVPDVPLKKAVLDGIFLPLKTTSDTPTIPPDTSEALLQSPVLRV